MNVNFTNGEFDTLSTPHLENRCEDTLGWMLFDTIKITRYFVFIKHEDKIVIWINTEELPGRAKALQAIQIFISTLIPLRAKPKSRLLVDIEVIKVTVIHFKFLTPLSYNKKYIHVFMTGRDNLILSTSQ